MALVVTGIAAAVDAALAATHLVIKRDRRTWRGGQRAIIIWLTGTFGGLCMGVSFRRASRHDGVAVAARVGGAGAPR